MKHLTMTLRAFAVKHIPALAAACLAAVGAHAAVPGIQDKPGNPVFTLTASPGRISQPDGQSIYTWGYGCSAAPAPEAFVPFAGTCGTMQIPGPTLVVTEGDVVTVTLKNALPAIAGNTSIVFAGLNAIAIQPPTANPAPPANGVPGNLTREAAPGASVTYTFTASKPGTYAYYSGTQADLQVEMGLFGAVIVRPKTIPTVCKPLAPGDFRLAPAAYDNVAACYDREYLFQWSEMQLRIHTDTEAAVLSPTACTATCPPLAIATEPYQPDYFMINGRSMPDDMDTSFAPNYPNQPYNGNPHMLPGELVLMRVIGQGRIQHPFHFHGNHARVLARDGNLILSQGVKFVDEKAPLAGPLLFTIATVSGQSVDAIFTWNGQGLNWDVYGVTNGHLCNGIKVASPGFDSVTHEYCGDHGKPLPVQPPDPLIVANGLWYGGTPYLGLQGAPANPLAPGVVRQNQDGGYAYMWHSHNEREITTSNVFPGGMMMMLIIDPPQDNKGAATFIDETQ